jgi:hypothetical protein
MRRLRCLPFFVLAVLFARPGQGQGIAALDFESYPGPDGQLGTPDDVPTPPCPGGFCGPLADEYASVGLTFDSGVLMQGDWFPGTPATNHYVSSSPLDATLADPGRSAAVESYSFWTVVLWLLDAQDQVLGTATLVNPSPGNLYSGTLSLASSTPYTRVTVRPEGCLPSDSCAQIVNLDNFTVAFVTIFDDGFESGDISAWSAVAP